MTRFQLLYSRFHSSLADPVAFIWHHRSAGTGKPCQAEFSLLDHHASLARPVVSAVPGNEEKALTVVEELVCPRCGRRGYVREGEWYDG
jgi:hypothetical protein